MTAHLYARVSTMAQASEGFSLAAQSERMRAFCAYQGLSDIQYWEDAGISGRRDDRPALIAMLKALKKGDTVVVYSLSRLGRGGAVQTLKIVEKISRAGARLVSLTENIDTETPTGKLMLTILAGLAELESETTKERSQQGRIQAAREGKMPINDMAMPFGYTRDAEGRPIFSDRADDARLIFQLKKGKGILSLTQEVNRLGIPTRSGKGQWSASVLHRMITNPAYKGQGTFRAGKGRDEVPVPFPALVTPDEWQAVQLGASTNPHMGNRVPSLYPLTGHVFCPHGVPLNGRHFRSRCYHTPNLQRKAYTCTCPVSIDADDLERRVRQLLHDTISNPDADLGLFARQTTPDPHAAEREALTGMLETLIDLHMSGDISREQYRARKAKLEEQLGALPQVERPQRSLNLPGMEAAAKAVLHCDSLELAELLDVFEVKIQVDNDVSRTLKLLHFVPLYDDVDDLDYV